MYIYNASQLFILKTCRPPHHRFLKDAKLVKMFAIFFIAETLAFEDVHIGQQRVVPHILVFSITDAPY